MGKSFTIQDWLDNYQGKTEVSKIANASVRDINGGDYIPWAMMYRVLVELDPDAVIEKVENEDGGYVFYDEHFLETETISEENGEITRKVTSVPNLSFYVKIKLTFHGKEYTEVMPVIASNTRRGTITKTFDNMAVHNAMQRGMAKVISMATGVGLQLWTREEFQDVEETPEVSPIPKKEEKKEAPSKEKTKKVLEKLKEEQEVKEVKPVKSEKGTSPLAKKPKEEEIKIDSDFEIVESEKSDEEASPIDEIIDIITKNRGNEALDKAFKSFNIILGAKGKKIDLEKDSTGDMKEKLSSVNNVEALLTSLKKGVGIDV